MAGQDLDATFDRRIADGMLATNDLPVGLSSLLGMRLDRFEPGSLWASLDVRPELLTPFGNLHGGAMAALVDHALGCVLYPHMARGQWAATTEFKLNYLNPVSSGTLVAEATIVNLTRRSAVVRIDVRNGDRAVAVAQGTVTIVDPRPPTDPTPGR
ncbi:MAG TPA: PaaI family thioesterase [Acidimicrobiia bacterium]|nr:PaaI family thioesterase [Acidimicrobiia bacterium]